MIVQMKMSHQVIMGSKKQMDCSELVLHLLLSLKPQQINLVQKIKKCNFLIQETMRTIFNRDQALFLQKIQLNYQISSKRLFNQVKSSMKMYFKLLLNHKESQKKTILWITSSNNHTQIQYSPMIPIRYLQIKE